MIPVCTPWLPGNEKKYALDAIDSNWISSTGKYVEKFERDFAKYCGVNHGVTCCNGSVAIHLACVALGLKKGDEVIVTDITNIASLNGIILAGAKPVLVDIEPDTWNMDPYKIEEKITKNTKAIMVVHIYGHPCDMDPIVSLAKKYKLFIIEDCAEAHGAEYKGKKCGSFGDISCFSFYANKILTTGEGGMCLTNDKSLADRMRLLKDLAFKVPRFLHDEIGFNYRLTNVQSAIGAAQVENIEMLVEARRNVGLKYHKLLKDVDGIILPVEKPYAKNVYWMFCIILKDAVNMTKDEVMRKLKEKGIDTRSFFIPMHQQPAYVNKTVENVPDCSGKFPIAEKISKRGFYLPSSSNITDKEIEFVCDKLKEVLNIVK